MRLNKGLTLNTFIAPIVKHRRFAVTITFLAQAALANCLAFLIRFDAGLTEYYLHAFFHYLPVIMVLRLLFFLQGGLYKGLWRYASISDLIRIIKCATLGSCLFVLIVRYGFGDKSYPMSVYILDWLLYITISGGTRFLMRVLREYNLSEPSRKRILILGAGDTGEMLVREMRQSREHVYEPVGFIDDNTDNKGLTIHDVPILGTTDMLPEIIRKYRPAELLISGANDTQKSIREIYDLCKSFPITIKKLPGIGDILDGNISTANKLGQRLIEANLVTEAQISEALALQKKEGGRLGSKLVKLGCIPEEKLLGFLHKQYGISHMKPISLEDLLQREQVKTDITSVREFIRGKSVMVTGAGGSIGSELCRQIIKYHPSHLMLCDRYENSTYEIDLELRADHRETPISTIIGDIQDTVFLDQLFFRHRPQIVFHAAAYKHVPLMEHNPIEAVKNNIFGTKNLIDAVSRHCAEKFILISTDKAVNPTSIMGATKRIAEFLTINMNSSCRTKFAAVRFGNVLGTNGSVIPIFKDQLKKGGPLTVTHPDIKRFFMLIPEAVQLVLIAAASGNGGELFVLDMGEQIKILDLAENFIRLSGFIPHKEIKITYSGLRPGEKMYEELFDETETKIPTFHGKLMMAIPETPSAHAMASSLEEFEHIIREYRADQVVPAIQKIVPNFNNLTNGQKPGVVMVDYRVH
ncbi:MAG: NAD-dependent epimerase/dehydratase family protein [Nitrospirae bacterium]|nr:NAD-dependent epimerase/dehydratase family protein [Nitrospirota bacterium]